MHSAEKQVTKHWCLEQLNTFSGVEGQMKLMDMCVGRLTGLVSRVAVC